MDTARRHPSYSTMRPETVDHNRNRKMVLTLPSLNFVKLGNACITVDSRCQSFTARRGPVVHLADLVVARSIIGCAARPCSASRYKHYSCLDAYCLTRLCCFDGCYSSKFLRSSARRFLLEVARAGLVH